MVAKGYFPLFKQTGSTMSNFAQLLSTMSVMSDDCWAWNDISSAITIHLQ